MSNRPSEPILARLRRLHPRRIDLSLDRIRRLLAALDHPEERLPPVVHIAGTNGKGSTLAMLHAMLAADGRRVHRYISPHLVRFNERILLDGLPIDEARLVAALDTCERANADLPITEFEITTAAAILAFAEEPADLLLLETGLGGEFDATNIVERPLLTLISPISMDHEAFLGDSLPAIAWAKAGILKPGVPAVIGPQQPAALAVIEARAGALGAPLLVHGRDWTVRANAGGLAVGFAGTSWELPRPALPGVHQIENAGLAVMAARSLGALAPAPAAVAQGLREASWEARLQRLREGRLAALLGPPHELWVDGGHNPAAGEALACSLPALAGDRPVHLVVGMLQTKDAAHFLAPLLPLARSLTTVPIAGEPSSRDAADLAALASSLGAPARAAKSVAAALATLGHGFDRPAFVLICGSLYLAGQVLADND